MTSDDWLPGPIALGAVLPLSATEISKLYQTNESLSPENEILLSGVLPQIGEMTSPDKYEYLISEWQRLSVAEKEYRKDLWEGGNSSSSNLESLHKRIKDTISIISDESPWILAALLAGQRGDQDIEPWNNLLLLVDSVCKQSAAFRENQIRYAPVINSDKPFEEQQAIIDEIIQHLGKSGNIGKMILACHPKWKRFINLISIVDGPPKTLPHFLALKECINLTMLRRELCGRWDRMLGKLGAPMSKDLPEDIENACIQYQRTIENCIIWYKDRWIPIEKDLIDFGFPWSTFISEQPPNLSPFGNLIRLRDAVTGNLQLILASRCRTLKFIEIDTELNNLLKKYLKTWGNGKTNSLLFAFNEALKHRDAVVYRKCCNYLVELEKLKDIYDMRNSLLSRLQPFAPGWTDAIRYRKGVHAKSIMPGEASSAWLWRQLNDELDRRGQVSLDELQKKIEILEDELRNVTTDLVNKKAWFHQSDRIGLSEQQALNGWLQLNARIGKGTGIRAPQLKRAAREAMSKSRSAVPVWIMPLARVVENFDPRSNRFDVVINRRGQSMRCNGTHRLLSWQEDRSCWR
jgi:hypothetical protein